MNEFDLAGRAALVSGSGQGVGKGIALLLAEHGAHVLINDLVAERADEVVQQIRSSGGTADAAVADVTNPEQVRVLAGSIGNVDILVNNAGLPPGMFQLKPFLELDASDWEPVIRLNFYAVMHMSQAFLPGMVDRGWGRIAVT
jgi:2-hydroxycyclohexanecarboxyl-CoA dehydrogenase